MPGRQKRGNIERRKEIIVDSEETERGTSGFAFQEKEGSAGLGERVNQGEDLNTKKGGRERYRS